MRPGVQVVPAFRDEEPDAHVLARTTDCSADEEGEVRSISTSSPTSLPCSEATNGTPPLVSTVVASQRSNTEASDGVRGTEQLPRNLLTTMLEPHQRTAASAFSGSPRLSPLSSPGGSGFIGNPGGRIGDKTLLQLEPINMPSVQFPAKALKESRTSASKGGPIREIPSRIKSPAEANTGDSCEYAKEGSRDSLESETTSKRHISMKTVASLPRLMRPQPIRHAEEHEEDISAEINALSKVSATDEEKEPPRFVLRHESTVKLGWDVFIMVLIVLSSFAFPIQIGFDIVATGGLLVVEVIVDFVFMLDVGMNFRTTVFNEATKETVTDVGQLSCRYIKGWFLIDMLGSLPVALVSHTVDDHSLDNYFLALKLLRTLKLHQLSVITTEVLKRFEDEDVNPAVFRIYFFVLAFLLALHFIACAYWAVCRLTDPDFEGNWTPEEYYLDDPLYLRYARAVYFALVINTGNDLGPENNVEYVFSILCLTLALCTNAIIIGSATNLLSNMDAGAVARKAHMDGINGYMRVQKLPNGLQRKIRNFYEYLWDSGQDKHSTGLFDEMPEKLKLQLNVALKKRLIEKVPLFKTCSPAGTIALVQNLSPSIILPGELIIRQGEPATSMFFISRGTVRVYVVPNSEDCSGMPEEENYIISLGDGSFFGEVALLGEKHARTANIRAETFTELQVLHGEDFQALSEIFPEFKAALDKISKSRQKARDALGKTKARGPFGGRGLSDERSVRQSSKSRFKQATATVVDANAYAHGQGGNRKINRLRIVAEQVQRVYRQRQRALVTAAQIRWAVPRRAAVIASRFAIRGQGMLSFAGSPRDSVDGHNRSVYDSIVAHEANISHESAMRVTRGGGIRQDTFKDI